MRVTQPRKGLKLVSAYAASMFEQACPSDFSTACIWNYWIAAVASLPRNDKWWFIAAWDSLR